MQAILPKKLWLVCGVMLLLFLSGCTGVGIPIDPNVASLHTDRSAIVMGVGEEVNIKVSALDREKQPLVVPIMSKVSGGGILSEDGTFRATQAGNYTIEYWANYWVRLTIPVCVVDKEYSELAKIVSDFSYAVDSFTIFSWISNLPDDFILYNCFNDWSPELTKTYLRGYFSFIKQWFPEDLMIHAENDTVTMEGLLRITDTSYDYIEKACKIKYTFIKRDGTWQLVRIDTEKLPVDPTNPPNVKAIVDLQPDEASIVGQTFSYSIGYNNVGGRGYYKRQVTLKYPDGKEIKDKDTPKWLEPAQMQKFVTMSIILFGKPGKYILTVEMLGGLTPDTLVSTDKQTFTITVE